MTNKIAVGIDIGTYQIKVVVAENNASDRDFPRVLGVGYAESKGLRHGYVVNGSEASRCIRQAVSQAEKTSGFRIKRAFLAVGGVGLEGVVSSGSVMVSRGDSEIDELDLIKVSEACEKEIPAANILNRKIIHPIPLEYKLDGKPILGSSPLGLRGNKLDGDMLFITCLEHHIHDFIEVVEEAGVEVIDIMAAPMAASLVTINKSQKIAGCALVNIGAETLSLVVFDESKPQSLEVFPVGSTNITNDIALGFKIPLDEAEHLKIGGITTFNFPKKKLDDIIGARMEDMLELIERHLKKIGRAGLLPAGIIITGGGASLNSVDDIVRNYLELPAKIATIHVGDKTKSPFKDSSWSVSYGLCLWGLSTDNTGRVKLARVTKHASDKVKTFFKQFLP